YYQIVKTFLSNCIAIGFNFRVLIYFCFSNAVGSLKLIHATKYYAEIASQFGNTYCDNSQ
ncbi:MAG: hypothetical protein ACO1G2_06430, partial [Bacteroidota bacterium]